jgi:hypothetical protein
MDYWRLVFDDLSGINHHDQIVNLLENSFIPHAHPENVNHLDIIAYGYKQAKQYKKSVLWAEKVCKLCSLEQKRGVRLNLSKLYISCNEPEKAEFYLDTNLKEDPNDIDSLIEYSVSLFMQNKKLESYKVIEEAKDNLKNKNDEVSNKNKKIIEFNRGAQLIHLGNFKEGMKCLSIGRELKIWGSYSMNLPIPKWNGEIDKNKSILFVGEGGIGDEIINSRFVYELNKKQLNIGIVSSHNLASIFSRMPFLYAQDYKSAYDINFQNFDYWAPMMDLPVLCDVDSKDLWKGPYISVCPAYKNKWDRIVGKKDKIKIGLKWSGNTLYDHDLHRSIPIEDIINKLDKNKFELYSLHKEEDQKIENLTSLSKYLETFEDALGAIDQMDVVVSSCTSIPHASSAMGKKTFVFVPIMSYYIWSEEKEKSSWYGDNLTLLRQTKPRDWSEQIDNLIKLL